MITGGKKKNIGSLQRTGKTKIMRIILGRGERAGEDERETERFVSQL